MASLYFRYGTMGSSKTASMIMVGFNYEERNMNVLFMKPKTDTRDGANIVRSRIGLERQCMLIGELSNVYELIYNYHDAIKPLDCVLVDEAQFLAPAQIDLLAKVVDDLKIPVICYGLRLDFQGNTFPGSARLLAIADNIEEIRTICWCGSKATHVLRLDEGRCVVREGNQVELGGNDKYVAVCRKHFINGATSKIPLFKILNKECSGESILTDRSIVCNP